MTRLRIAGLILLAGAVITFALHFAEAPEHLYRWLYRHLLSGLDVPSEPSDGTVDAVHYTSLIGGIAELVAGLALLGVDLWRSRAASR